jgi:hypothetical protein
MASAIHKLLDTLSNGEEVDLNVLENANRVALISLRGIGQAIQQINENNQNDARGSELTDLGGAIEELVGVAQFCEDQRDTLIFKRGVELSTLKPNKLSAV